MAERYPSQELTVPSPIGSFTLRETVTYPNGGQSQFYTCGATALIIDDGICEPSPDGTVFDYSLITTKQNGYVSRYDRLYRLLRDDLDQLEGLMRTVDLEYDPEARQRHVVDRTQLAETSPPERAFEEHFSNVYGDNAPRYLAREYGITDAEGHTRYIDYLVSTKHGLVGIGENGVHYHHPQLIGVKRWRTQLLKQNSCQRLGIKLFRFSSEDIRFTERFEDDIRSYLGKSADDFIDAGIVVGRPFELYEHQEGALEEMARRRADGLKSFLAVLPTGTGKSQIVIEDLARVAPTLTSFRALITAPNTAIVQDWTERVSRASPISRRHRHLYLRVPQPPLPRVCAGPLFLRRC